MTRYKKKCEKCSERWRLSMKYQGCYHTTRFIEYHNYYMKRLLIREYEIKIPSKPTGYLSTKPAVHKTKFISIGWICPRCKQVILDNPEIDNTIPYISSSKQLPKHREFTEEELKLDDYKTEVLDKIEYSPIQRTLIQKLKNN